MGHSCFEHASNLLPAESMLKHFRSNVGRQNRFGNAPNLLPTEAMLKHFLSNVGPPGPASKQCRINFEAN
jgi:hypothetical protein